MVVFTSLRLGYGFFVLIPARFATTALSPARPTLYYLFLPSY